MADITKCSGAHCSLKESCYRFRAEDSEFRQSYFITSPLDNLEDCKYYWPFKSEDELEQLNIENADWP